ncbi:MAG: hypothetical protein QOC68_3352 [Solirubrobacteraceae bacterium]|nr:hypothetical protein [Solirubrobacteraceae bacterium]
MPWRAGRRLAIVGILVGLSAPSPAHAHIRSGIIATDYRATVTPLGAPLRTAVAVRIYETDRAVRLAVAPGHTVTVLARSGEPLLRIDSDGLALNKASRAAVEAGLLPAAGAAPGAGPAWHRRSRDRSVVWHDARLRGLPDTVDYARWAVPVILDGAHLQLEGDIRRVRSPSAWWWLGFAASFGALIALALLLRHPTALRTAQTFGMLAAAATIAVTVTFALASSASGGSRFVAFDLLVFAGVGIAAGRRPEAGRRVAAAGGLGLLAISVGLLRIPALIHGVVLSPLPATATRVLVVLALCAGAGAIAAAAAASSGVTGLS